MTSKPAHVRTPSAQTLAGALSRYRARANWKRISQALTWSVFVGGAIWRWLYVVHHHDPRDYVYADMAIYVDLAKRFTEAGYEPGVADMAHPLGLPTVLSWLYARDPSMQTMVYFQFIVCALVPLAVGGLAWVAFGAGSGKLAVAASSLYVPFVDYGGYFLTEIHLAFTFALGVGLALFAVRKKKVALAVAIGLLAGLAFSLSQVTKVMGFPAMACFLFFFAAIWRGPPRRIRGVVLLAVVLGAVPINAWQFSRCTTANHGHFCLGTTKGASDFLLGHYGRIYSMTWHDPGGEVIWFGSPSAAQHGYTERPEMDFGLSDNAKNLQMGMRWIKDNPRSALFLSLEHVYDLFFGSFPWPSVATNYWLYAAGGHYLFITLLFFPSCVRLLDILRRDGPGALLGCTEVLLLAPLIGLVVTAAIGTGEPRYRFPFDSLFIVVSIEFFRNFRMRRTGAA